MKKIFILSLSLLLVAISSAWSENPTVTVTKTTAARYHLYTINFSTGVLNAALDTAFIFNENNSWFPIEGVGAHPTDSLITMECFAVQTSMAKTPAADSVRFTILWQVSSATSPSVTTGLSPSSDWVTALNDITTFSNVTVGSSPLVAKFPKMRLAGQATKMRILVLEQSQSKGVRQSVTLRLLIPRR